MTNTMMTEPLHVAELSTRQVHALALASVAHGRNLVDPCGYVADDAVAAELRALED